jgi:hypothetical protein
MRTFLTLSKRTEFIKTVAAAGTPERLTAGTITAITRIAGYLVEATVTPVPHSMLPGSEIVISGANETEFNGSFTITERTSTSKVRFFCPGASAAVTGSPVYYANVWFRHAILLGLKAFRTANAAVVYVGGSSANDEQPYGVLAYDPGNAGEAYLPAAQAGPQYENLADYYLDVSTNGDGLLVRYI